MKSIRKALALGVTVAAALSWTTSSIADDTHKKHTTGTSTGDSTGTNTQDTVSPPVGDPSLDPYPSDSTTTPTTTTPSQEPIQTTQQPQPQQRGTIYDSGATYPVGTTTTTSANYNYQTPADTESREYRPNRPMLITGGALFAAGYVPAVIVGAASDQDHDKRLYIPVVGPWLDMADRPCGIGDCSTREDVNQALLIGSGVAQGAGVALAIASLFVPEDRDDRRAKSPAPALAQKPQFKVTPISLRGGGGFGAIGTF